MINIISVVGHADAFDLVFTHEEDGRWAVLVPPDLADGRYICDIHATNEIGEIAYWTGILYMADSRFVVLYLTEDTITAYLLPETQFMRLADERINVSIGRRCD